MCKSILSNRIWRKKKCTKPNYQNSITEIKRWNFLINQFNWMGVNENCFLRNDKKKSLKKRVYILSFFHHTFYLMCKSNLFYLLRIHSRERHHKNEIPKNSNQFSIHKIYFLIPFCRFFVIVIVIAIVVVVIVTGTKEDQREKKLRAVNENSLE